ncbi:MAG TPA: hypothetical protein VF146_17010 [Bryobacteraceae bacterium]
MRFAINNLFDQHNTVGIVPGTASNTPQPNDVVTLLPGRSVSLTMTFGYAPHI